MKVPYRTEELVREGPPHGGSKQLEESVRFKTFVLPVQVESEASN